MRWFERPDILSYIIECYAGTDEGHQGGARRQFIWEQPNGDMVIGNPRAFTDHVAEKFGIQLTPTSWSAVHAALRELGEVARENAPHRPKEGRQRFHNQQPEIRILKKGRSA
jgi:hypothetical protein